MEVLADKVHKVTGRAHSTITVINFIYYGKKTNAAMGDSEKMNLVCTYVSHTMLVYSLLWL